MNTLGTDSENNPPAQERSTAEVFESHLNLRKAQKLEEDIRTNYAENVVMMTGLGKFNGHDGVRQAAANLEKYFGGDSYEYKNKLVDGEVAYLEWTGVSHKGSVCDGTDTFLIRNGRIQVQTIHYTVDRLESRPQE